MRTPFQGNQIPTNMIAPVSAKILAEMPKPSGTDNGAWVFTTRENPNVVHITPWNFLPRFGAVYTIGDSGDQVVRFACGRYTSLGGRQHDSGAGPARDPLPPSSSGRKMIR